MPDWRQLPIEMPPGWVLLAMLGGCLLLGVVLLLWGRILGRAYLGLCGAAVGVGVGGWLRAGVSRHPAAICVAGAAAIGILCMILARLVWGLLAGMLFGAATFAFLAAHYSPKVPEKMLPAFAPAAEIVQAYQEAGQAFLVKWMEILWNQSSVVLAGGLFLSVGIPLLICLIRPRLGTIFMTSLIGAAKIVFAAILVVALLLRSWLPNVQRVWYVPGAVAGVLLVFGMVFQYVRAFAAEKAGKDREAEPPPKKGRSEAAASTEKGR